MNYIIYKITNKINGKIYIGQTIGSLSARWHKHCRTNSKCMALKNAIQKYGKENFTIKLISHCESLNLANHREEYYIKIMKSLNPMGYNILLGGNNRVLSENTKNKISKTLKGRKQTVVHKKNHLKGIQKRFRENKPHPNSINALQKNCEKWKKPVICLENNRIFKSVSEAARYINSNSSNVSKQINGKFSHVKGFHFEYIRGEL